MSAIGRFNETERTVAINTSSSGDNSLISAPGVGKRIYVDHLNLLSAGTTTVTFKNGSTALSGAYAMTAGAGIALDNSAGLEHGILECSDNTAFIVNLGSAVSVQGFVRYRIMNE